MAKQYDFLIEKALRDKAIDRVEVLERVGELLLLPNTEYATTEQVAKYYRVGLEAVKTIVKKHSDEIEADGYRLLSGEKTRELLVRSKLNLTKKRGYFEAAGQKFAYNSNGLFPKRAILRVGMLLRDSEVAKEVRTRLLNILHDVEQPSPEIIQNIVDEFDERTQLIFKRTRAEVNGHVRRVR